MLDRFAARRGVPVHAVAMSRRITPRHDLQSLWGVRRVLCRLRPHVVHGHTPKGGLLAMLAAWLCRVPVRVYHLHGLPLATATGLKRRLLRRTEQLACALATQVLCVSRSLREAALKERLCRPDKITVLLEGNIDGVEAERVFNPALLPPESRLKVREQFGIPADALVLGFVGRVVRDKGVAELAAAWQQLRGEFPDLHLLIVGPVEPQDPIPPETAAVLRDDPRVHLAGDELELVNMPRWYGAMDLVVLPSYREGFGVVLLEAAAMGLPVVATQIPGCRDAVKDGETGTLVPPRDAPALAQVIRQYLCDPDRRCRHGQAGRARALRDFRPEAMRAALFAEYARLLGRCRKRPVRSRQGVPSRV
jgi:glycosyltransferase involved in cell wall biosynthesis